MEKMTNAKALEYVVENFEVPTEVAEKLNNMIASLKKKSENRKPTKTQKENEVLKEKVLEVMTTEPKTISEIMALDEELNALSNQKVTSLVRALKEDGKVVKSTDKKKALYALA